MELIPYFKVCKILLTFQKWKKTFEKIVLIEEIMTLKSVVETCLNYDQNTCDSQSTSKDFRPD